MAPPTVRVISTSSSSATSGSKPVDSTSHAEHMHRRCFIGPMPQKALPTAEELKKLRKHTFSRLNSADTTDEELTQIIREHARSFFLHEGGREEDWDENEEQSTREEMYRRWKESEWGVALRRLRRQSQPDSKTVPASNWIGGSFEIGNIAGINIITESETLSKISSRSSTQPLIPLDSIVEPLVPSSHTAPLEPSESSVALSPPDPSSHDPGLSIPDTEQQQQGSRAPSPSSSTALLRPSVPLIVDSGGSSSEPLRRSIIKLPSFSHISDSPNQGKKKVHYDLSPVATSPSLAVSPTEVLERTGTDVSGTSAGAMSIFATDDQQIAWGEIVMRDRMFVRVYSTELVDMFTLFDESIHRVTRDLKFEDWGEFLVVWRMDRIEVYENYTIPGKEWLTGHKHLAFIIPVKDARTRLCLYSFVDLTFCITCSPTSRRYNPVKAKWTINSSKEGSNIFIFKLKSRTRAFDWIWQLWRHRGGTFPPAVEIRNPRLDSKLKIDMPNVDNVQTYKIFSKDNLIALCTQSLKAVPDWKYLVERQLAEGNVLRLCWRAGSYLDWIWLDDDVDGHPRDWEVLCGLALKQLKVPVHLELRLGQHHPGFMHQKDGSRLAEPPSIEGYVDRIKSSTHAKQALYLVTHEGNLFVLNPTQAHPPTPLGVSALLPIGPDVSNAQTLRISEVGRGIDQVLDANGVVDLRSILVVRRAQQPAMQHTHDVSPPKDGDDESWVRTWSVSEEQVSQSDQEDVGGEEGLSKSGDKRQLKTRRSFELLLTNGHVLRFEAYSCIFAHEWIYKLRSLVHYWRMKHRSDAREEMELAQASRPLVTPHTYAESDKTIYAEPPFDPASSLPALGSIFGWCALEACKPITKSGKVFMRKGLHGQYQLVDLVLVREHLVQFRISPKSVLHSSTRQKIHLTDAYVYSGYLAAQMLPAGQLNSDANSVPRRYHDGLETDDPEEDRLFVIWYRKTTVAPEEPDLLSATASSTSTPSGPSTTKIPPLGIKRKIAIFRTRSKLERDAWCWALNNTIEKAVRARKERERKIRESGTVMVM